MDPLTTVLIAAVAPGALAGLSASAKAAVEDGYAGLKALIARKYGADSELAKAAEGVRAKPDSPPRQEVLAEEVADAKAHEDPEMLAAAQALLEMLQAQPGGASVVQHVVGSYNAVASDHSTASVNVNHPKP